MSTGEGSAVACGHATYGIVGAGPAGVQLAYYLGRVGLGYWIVERGSAPGEFFRAFPRHRKLISINKVHTGYEDPERNLRWDWNSLLSEECGPLFSEFSERYFPAAEDLLQYLAEYVRRHEIEVAYGFDAVSIEREVAPASAPGRFRLTARDGRVLTCDRLIVASGVSEEWRPSIPGAELCDSYASVSVDAEDFTNQRVLVVGKGNSGFETANHLIEKARSIHVASPEPLEMAWRSHYVGHLRAVNNDFLDTYQLKSQNAVLDAEIVGIEREGSEFVATFRYAHAHGEVEMLRYDRVIFCTGFRFSTEPFGDSCRPALRGCGRLPLMSSQWESPNVPGLFFAGVLTQTRDYRRYMSAFIHGFRYNTRALVRMLEERYHGTRWPSRSTPATPAAVAEAMLDRINRSSALWQQPGFLADVVEIDAGMGRAEYYEELPVDFALEGRASEGRWLVVTLEYGTQKAVDPFRISRVHRSDIDRAAQSQFLHPVVRHYFDGEMVSEHHVLEDLAGEWVEREHVEPLEAYVAEVMSAEPGVRVAEGKMESEVVARGASLRGAKSA